MKRFLLLFLVGFALSGLTIAQVIDISVARTRALNTEVTISGIVTCDTVADIVRYMQDATAGIATYDSPFAAAVSRGDSVTVTGTLKEYGNLLEIDPVTSYEIHSSDNPLPEPIRLIPSQLGEQYEGMLAEIANVIFPGGGYAFSAGTYLPTADGEQLQMYVHVSSPLNGEIIPNQTVTLIGIVTQHFDDYQMAVRGIEDLIPASSIYFTSILEMTNLTQSGFDLSWTTNASGTTELFYGNTPDLELGKLTGTGDTTNHAINITGRDPAELVFVQAITVADDDTAFSGIKVFVTQSASSGDMKVYFNNTVDTSVSIGTDAIQLFHAIDDTLISYINRAKYTIDLTIYNYNTTGISDITAALNAAHSRGVEIRIINDFNVEDNNGFAGLDAAIGRIVSPEDNYEAGIGIMHNKFVVFDANSPDPNDPLVWTGATNFTSGQINTDPNNVIIIQDQSLAKTYRIEFEEMFGSSGLQPDPVNAKFGANKSNNTPHEFIIGGSRVESYFSPSDGTNNKIEETIRTGNHQVFVNTMLNTRTPIAYAVVDMADAGADAKVLINSEGQSDVSTVLAIFKELGDNFRDYAGSGILHHKTLIVDPDFPESDPILLTGCHNWSSSADTRNDENTLIIHNQDIANIYYQEFVERFKQGEIIADVPETNKDFETMNQGDTLLFNVLDNDVLPGAVTVNITSGPFHGTATMAPDGVVTYIPKPTFAFLDTINYKVCMVSNSSYCDSASLVVNVKKVSPVLTNDFTTMDQRDTLIYDVLDNDVLPGAVTVTALSGPFHGTVSIDANGVITYIPDPKFSFLDTIIYEVCMAFDPDNCESATFVINVKQKVGIDTKQMQNEFEVYHNPVLNQVLITNKTGEHLSGQMNLYSITGQLVESAQHTWSPGYNQVQLSGQYNGIYILEIRYEEGVFRKKLLLQ
jgi:phosphatidylserine/phosphatidylglycerophosphate/cardiolipin synthase-like enzyme